MCGILGYSGYFDFKRLHQANLLQAHRGPDDSGHFIDQVAGVGLGHVRLSIIDLSPLGHQPMLSEDGSIALVFNGEIYNFRELRAKLEAKGHRFRGHSDTEVLMQLYMAEGEEMLAQMNGIFAFALWDKCRDSIFMARDAFGVKPLYYAETSQGVVFASEIKSLLCLAPGLRELDIPALHRYLSFLWCPGEGTPLKAVRKLLPGQAMTVRAGKVTRHWRWYQLPVFRGIIGNLSRAEARTGIVENLRQAVHRQLVADVPVGAFLSGGLDSSAVVAFAREQAPDIRCFTIEVTGGQEAGVDDDLPFAKRVAKYLKVPLDIISIDSGRMASDLAGMVAQLDEPLADPAPLNVYYISKLARKHGIKVLLSGAGGDDLFTGYLRHLAVQYEHYWNWLPQRFRSGIEQAFAVLDQRIPLFRRLARVSNGAGMAGDARMVNYFIWAREALLFGLYSPEFRAQLGRQSASDPMLDFLRPLPSSVKPLDRILALEQRFFLTDHNLTYTDKMSMATGVEVRVPYLDLDLVEHAARIPVKFKQYGHISKWILKKAMEPYLPKDVIYRRKTGFGAPLRRWIRHELSELLGDLLSEESIRRRGLFEPVAVHRLIAQNNAGRVDAAYTILSLLSIEIWCRVFLDGVQAGIRSCEV